MSEQIQVKKPGFVDLAGSVDELDKRFKLYQDVKKKLLTENDTVKIGDVEYIKKSGRTKFEVAFNLSTIILEERKEVNSQDPTKFAYHFTVECKADNGRIIQDVGTCDNTEKPKAAEHIIRSMAKTRATSRAVFEMIGAGDMSAEEMEAVENDKIESNFCHCDPGKKDIDPTTKKCRRCGKLETLNSKK